MYIKAFLCILFVGHAFAQDYADDQEAREQQYAPNYVRQGYNDIYETAPAEPYDFGFQSTDEFGTIMNRQESSDSKGAVRGSYGYTDPFGVFRHVDYVADEFGFRAEVKSNEPGMGTASPANVQIYAEPPPAGVIVERPYYHQPGQNIQGGQQGSRKNPTAAASNSNANRQVRPAARIPVASTTRTSVYPYITPQQNAFSSNALGGSSQHSTAGSNQYPSTVSNQYAANAASASSNQYGSEYQASASNAQYGSGNQGQSASNGQYGASNGQYGASNGQYGASNGQYGASNGQYGASNGQYGASNGQYGASNGQHGARNAYSQGYSAHSATAVRATTGSASSTSNQPIVPRPYDGPTYKIGNPHVTELVKPDRKESGSILLPTVVTTGGGPTLIKHIHAYPAAPASNA